MHSCWNIALADSVESIYAAPTYIRLSTGYITYVQSAPTYLHHRDTNHNFQNRLHSPPIRR